MNSRVFMIGTSAGGVQALHKILGGLKPAFVAPLIIIQHLPDVKHVDLKSVYPVGHGREVVEIEDKMPIEPRHVYFAPGGYHMLIERDETFSLTQDEPVRYSRPSIDLSLETAARSLGSRLVAMILTGANGDGAEGLRAVRDKGGICIVQDPLEAEHPEMPLAAVEALKPDHLVRLEQIPSLLEELGATR